MKNNCRTFLTALTFLFLVGSSSVVFADDSHDVVIKEIRFLFSKWQPILKNVQKEGVKKSKTLIFANIFGNLLSYKFITFFIKMIFCT